MYYLELILNILYKLLPIVPSLIILLALTKLNKRYKYKGLKIAIVATIGNLFYAAVIHNGYLQFIEKGIIHSKILDKTALVMFFMELTFSLTFATGVYLYVKEILRSK